MKNKWEEPRCNFCSDKESDVVLDNVTTWITKGKYKIVKCRNCNLVYLSPRPKKEYILKYYPAESYWGVGIVNSENEEGKKHRDIAYNFVYNKIFAEKKKGSILDLGAGTGLFLSKFLESGWNCLGVELSKEACGYAKRVYGVKMLKGSFPEIKLPSKKYDVVTLNGCLEHLYKPKESLQKVYEILNKKGLIEITVPNFDSLGRRIFKNGWYALQPPSHLYHFAPTTVKRILTEAGFKNIEI